MIIFEFRRQTSRAKSWQIDLLITVIRILFEVQSFCPNTRVWDWWRQTTHCDNGQLKNRKWKIKTNLLILTLHVIWKCIMADRLPSPDFLFHCDYWVEMHVCLNVKIWTKASTILFSSHSDRNFFWFCPSPTGGHLGHIKRRAMAATEWRQGRAATED